MSMLEPKKVYDVVTGRELTCVELLDLMLKHARQGNWKTVRYYLDLLVRSLAHITV